MRKKWIIAGAVILAVLGAVFTAEAWRDRNAGAPAYESRVSSYTKKEEGKKSETKARGRETEAPPSAAPDWEPTAEPESEPAETSAAEPDGVPAVSAAPLPDAEETPETSGQKPADTEASEASKEQEEEERTCVLSVRCDTLLAKLERLKEEKRSLVPADGVLFPETEVVFYEGESVFHVLQREMKKSRIHMEFVNTPGYQSAYIEGIGNLYEFDCGGLSGWMYRVNGQAPGYGSSRYQLTDGDVVEWLYTCDLGRDVGSELEEMQR